MNETYVDKMQLIHFQKTISKESIIFERYFYSYFLYQPVVQNIFFILVIPSNVLFCLKLST